MKKVLISLVISLIVWAVLAIKFCNTPSNIVNCFTVDNDGLLYVISEYSDSTYMLISGSGKTHKAVNIEQLFGGYRQYMDIMYVHDELYVISQFYRDEEYLVGVDRFDVDGNWKGELLTIALDDIDPYFEANFTEFYDFDTDNSDKLYINVSTGNMIYCQEIGRNGKVGALERYSVDGMEPEWAGHNDGYVLFRDEKSEYYIIDQDNKVTDIGTPGIWLERPCLQGSLLIGVDLGDQSMGCAMLTYDVNGNIDSIERVTEIIYSSPNRELADGIVFSDLRNFKQTSWTAGEYNQQMGLVKADGERGKIVVFNDLDGNTQVYDEPLLPPLRGVIFGLVFAAAAFVVILLILMLTSRLLALRKVVVKQVLISGVLVVWAFGLMYYSFYRFVGNFMDNAEAYSLSDTLTYIALNIDAEGLKDGISEEEQKTIFNYESKAAPTVRMDKQYKIPGLISMKSTIDFVRVAKLDDDGFRYVYNFGLKEPAAKAEYYTSSETLDKIANLTPGEFVVTRSKSDNRSWFEESCGIYDDSGKMTGFVMVGFDYSYVKGSVVMTALTLSVVWSVIIVTICAAFLLFLVKLLSPLKKIKKAVSEISEGKIGTKVMIRTNDELQDIAYSFSEMSGKLEDYFNSINVISKAYERYLPKDFFRLMDKRSVLDVSPEDSRNLLLTYLFIGMDMTRVHSGGENGFALLNRIYGHVSSAVSSFGGAVQSLDDRQMTCIFSADISSAAEAALMIREKLTAEALNDADVKITLQRAESTIGVIGTGEAMKPVTVSSAIEMQQYIAAVMKEFGLSYVITGRVLEGLAGLNINARYIGMLSELTGMSDSRFDIKLYEVPEGCCDEVKQRRLATLAAFNRGMDALQAGDMREARNRMIEVLRTDRGDLIARYYLMKCDRGSGFLKENKDELRSN